MGKPQYRDNILLKKIAKRVKELRAERGLSQLDVVYNTEINIVRVESGEANVSVSTIKKLCNYFGVTLEDFFKGF